MFEFHGYVAVTLVEPTGSVDVVNVALPLVISTVPSVDFPAVKLTRPVGVVVGEVIRAVKVTTCPWVDGFGDEVSVVELVACCTTWFKIGDALGPLLASPKYTANSG